MFIYKITNNIDGKIYIGATTRTIEERMKEHYRKHITCIDKAIYEQGKDNFIVEVVEECSSKEDLMLRENYWVKYYKCIIPNGYNMCEGGGKTIGFKHREESKKRMSASQKIAQKGSNNSFYGKTHSDEQKAKWSRERKGRKMNDEWIAHIREANKKNRKKVINLDTGEIYESCVMAGEKLNVAATNVSRACKSETGKCRGYRLAYYIEESV